MEVTTTAALDAGARLLDAIGAQDFARMEGCFASSARLRAMVPSMLREEEGAAAIVARFRLWWEDLEQVELVESELEPMADCVRLRYRLRAHDRDDGWVTVEQTGYFHAEDGGISVLNLVCSGFRPAE
jgi:hypothetical protein